jgi:hypothetical protein
MFNAICKAFIPFSLFAAIALNGCSSYDDYGYGGSGVVVDRGYYFDPDYYDAHGGYHGRSYWYYDGHSYIHRDGLPQGEVAHLRTSAVRGGGEIGHAGDSPHGADSSHGAGGNLGASGGEHGGGDGGSVGGGGGGGGGHGR